jgi:hypothetical protein
MGELLERVRQRRRNCGFLDSLAGSFGGKAKKGSRILVGHRVEYVFGKIA